jgi:hypothetical protein
MKSAKDMLDERLTIQEGNLKGARITISESIAQELMEEYHSQFCKERTLSREVKLNTFDSHTAASSE